MQSKDKVALITGITGQDGSYLARYLLDLGYTVHGIKRRSSMYNTGRIDDILRDRHDPSAKLFLHYGDLSDSLNITKIIEDVQPNEVYNLGAMSHVHVSFEEPEYTAQIDGLGALRVLEAIRLLGAKDDVKVYQASTSELYGDVLESPQSETTPFNPQSPYAVAKAYAFYITKNYREAYNLFASNGILFNHESPLRGENFVTRKITRATAAIALGRQNELLLGNLDSVRDWGHARDYVKAMHLILQHPKPDDFVIATGQTNSVREFVAISFKEIGIDIEFQGEGKNESGRIRAIDNERFFHVVGTPSTSLKVGQTVVRVSEEYFRPSDVNYLCGDPSKAINELGWVLETSFDDMVSEMMIEDVRLARRGLVV